MGGHRYSIEGEGFSLTSSTLGCKKHNCHTTPGEKMSGRVRILAVAALWLLMVLGHTPVWADIYVYIDAEGVMHFTNAPTHGRYKVFMKENRTEVHASPGRSRSNPAVYDALIHEYSRKYGVDSALVKAIVKAESDFDPSAISGKGAQGLMQLMPDTAQKLNVLNPLDPKENIEGGVRYVRYLLDRFGNDMDLCVAAYNAGETTVYEKGGIPAYAETLNYVAKVRQFYQEYKAGSQRPQ